MDEKLHQIFKIRPLQAKCVAYRNSLNDYRKVLREAYSSEHKKLKNVEIALDQVKLEKPAAEKIPPIGEMPDVNNFGDVLKETLAVKQAIELLK